MLVWILVVLSIFLPFVLGRIIDPISIDWSKFEVAAICLGGIGIVSAVGEARRVIPGNKIVYLRPRVLSWLRTIEINAPKYRDIFERRATQAISNRDQYASMVPWCARLVQLAKSSEEGEPPSIRSRLPPLPDSIDDSEITVMIRELSDAIDDYEKARATYEANKLLLERTGIEEFGILIAPYLICAAIACSLLSSLYR